MSSTQSDSIWPLESSSGCTLRAGLLQVDCDPSVSAASAHITVDKSLKHTAQRLCLPAATWAGGASPPRPSGCPAPRAGSG